MSMHALPVRSTTSTRDREEKPRENSRKSVSEKTKPYTYYFEDMFLFKKKELEEKEREKLINRSRKVHEKTTFSSRMKNRSHLGGIHMPVDSVSHDLGLDSTVILSFVERSADAKKPIQEFIRDQRERFMLEYTLATKRKTIMKLQKRMEMKEQQLLNAEKRLQEDAFAFEEFLRENDQKSVDALKIAAQETIGKLQMTSELKKANLEIQVVKSEITKSEFLLKEYLKYGCFLLRLSPKAWQMQQSLKKMKNKDITSVPSLPKLVSKTSSLKRSKDSQRKISSYSTTTDDESKKGKKSSVEKRKLTSPKAASVSSEDSLDFGIDEIDCDLEPELYFKDPEELLQVFTELEEQNLTLVQYSQDVDETLDDVSKREKVIQDKVNNNIEALLTQKEMLKNNCAREEEKAAELELRSRLFSFGEFNSEIQEKLIESLSKKVNQVYKVCIGDVDIANLNPVQKLVKVESRLVELSDLIDSVPKENIEVIEKAKQRERRQKLREEKLREKQRSQEEKIRIALERAVSQPKKKMGRRLVFRSQPLSDIKQEILFVDDTKSKLLEEQFFFT
ncbi:coiled-coil domain-containing protein 38 [Antechinus flavipes]|uniref:coiled-coil domain-containing protein 38 n=1 Tax=Antechinus flavipes TaxID=38775 RepID=UPI0022362B7E|nr:coiled-coil domain-containing protein 38 [Antechinus flavipes]